MLNRATLGTYFEIHPDTITAVPTLVFKRQKLIFPGSEKGESHQN